MSLKRKQSCFLFSDSKNAAVIFGDHTGVQWSDLNINGQIVLETLNAGQSYARTRLTWDSASKKIVDRSVDFVVPNRCFLGALLFFPVSQFFFFFVFFLNRNGISADPTMISMLDEFKSRLGPILSRVVTSSPFVQARDGNCKFLPSVRVSSLLSDVFF